MYRLFSIVLFLLISICSAAASQEIENPAGGYTELEVAAGTGNAEQFIRLFLQNGPITPLKGFHAHPGFEACNLADLTAYSSYSTMLDSEMSVGTRIGAHKEILSFLELRGIVPVCPMNGISVRVNGTPIMESEVEFYRTILFQEEAWEQIVDYLIGLQVQSEAARQNGLSLQATDMQEIEQDLAEVEKRYPQWTSGFVKHLLVRDALADLARQSLYNNVTVSDEELRRYYDTNPEDFDLPERIHTRYIELQTREEFDEIQRTKGFPAGGTGDNSIQDAVISKDELSEPEIEKTLWSLEAGKVAYFADDKKGEYYIVQVLEKLPAEKLSLEAAKEGLSAWMIREKIPQELELWVETLKENALIE